MCGRFTTDSDVIEQLRHLVADLDTTALDAMEEHPPRYNIAPTQPVVTLWRDVDTHQSKAGFMRWGLVPVWVKDPRDFPLIINARVETIMEKPSFRGALRHHRCVIPARGYYEWQVRKGAPKLPHFITRKDDQPLWLAGVWSDWLGATGEQISTTAIITVAAGQETMHLHHRTPAILEADQVADWLDIDRVNEKRALKMLAELPDNKVKFHPVSTAVNSVSNDSEKLIEEVSLQKPEPPKSSPQMDLF